MPKKIFLRSIFIGATCLLITSIILSNALAWKRDAGSANKILGNDEQIFVFMGRCADGAIYRLTAYEKELNGVSYSFYDYEGPAGKGTVKTETPPKTMAVRMCRALAEITDDQ